MSTMLNLADHLLAHARQLQALQQHPQAAQYLGRLAQLRDLPTDVAEETQFRLAEIRLKQKSYRRARQHLTAALLYQAECGRYHYMMATAFGRGRDRDLERALKHYRRAIELDPEQAVWLADFGICCLRLRKVEEGLGALCRAVQLAPNDPAIVRKLTKGLCAARRDEEAEEVLRAARFRNPRDGRFAKLWSDFRYRQLIRTQLQQLRQQDEGPTILPFSQPAETPARERPIIRQDGPTPLPGPHNRRPTRRPDRKHG